MIPAVASTFGAGVNQVKFRINSEKSKIIF